jgi:hypothetical protein
MRPIWRAPGSTTTYPHLHGSSEPSFDETLPDDAVILNRLKDKVDRNRIKEFCIEGLNGADNGQLQNLRERIASFQFVAVEGVDIQTMTASEILAKTYAEPKWAIPGLLPVGMTVMGGKPKIGKSWMMLEWGLAVSLGRNVLGTYCSNQAPCLYLALEDNERRLQDRLRQIAPAGLDPTLFYIHTRWKKQDQNGLDDLKRWLDRHPGTVMVLIDTWKRFRPVGKGRWNQNIYDKDYEDAMPIQALAMEREINITLSTHLTKAGADDPLEEITGSLGFTGAADTIMVLKRERGELDGSLFITGRDVDEREVALGFKNCVWRELDGSAEEYRLGKDRGDILRAVRGYNGVTPSVVAEELGRNKNTVKTQMRRLAHDGKLHVSGGKYYLPEE